MSPDPDEYEWLHLVVGTIGVFVLLNQSFGTIDQTPAVDPAEPEPIPPYEMDQTRSW